MGQVIWQSKALRQLKKIKPTLIRNLLLDGGNNLDKWPEVDRVRKLVNKAGYRRTIGEFRILFIVESNAIEIMEVRRRNESTYK